MQRKPDVCMSFNAVPARLPDSALVRMWTLHCVDCVLCLLRLALSTRKQGVSTSQAADSLSIAGTCPLKGKASGISRSGHACSPAFFEMDVHACPSLQGFFPWAAGKQKSRMNTDVGCHQRLHRTHHLPRMVYMIDMKRKEKRLCAGVVPLTAEDRSRRSQAAQPTEESEEATAQQLQRLLA
jgi:hypothetical protein